MFTAPLSVSDQPKTLRFQLASALISINRSHGEETDDDGDKNVKMR